MKQPILLLPVFSCIALLATPLAADQGSQSAIDTAKNTSHEPGSEHGS